jgi:cadmium resistance protein CadD (predicted permease)
LAAESLGADLAIAAAAFVGTNIDNCLVTTAMVAGAPVERAHRIAAGQVAGFVVIVAASAAAAIVLFEFSPAVVGLLGLVPLAIGLRGLWALRRREARKSKSLAESGDGGDAGGGRGGGDSVQAPAPAKAWTGARARVKAKARGRGRGAAVDRAVGRSFTAALFVTVAAGGDNLAVYIPLFRVGGATNLAVIAAVFVVGEAVLTALVLWGGRHPRARAVMANVGHVAVPVMFCILGVVVMAQAGTFGLL